MKKLYRNDGDVVITGLLSGIGDYFDLDANVIRIGFVVLVLLTGVFPGIIAYIIAFLLIPEAPHALSTTVTPHPQTVEEPVVKEEAVETPEEPVEPETMTHIKDVIDDMKQPPTDNV